MTTPASYRPQRAAHALDQITRTRAGHDPVSLGPRRISVLGLARRLSREHPDRVELDSVRRALIVARAREGYDTTVERDAERELRKRLDSQRAITGAEWEPPTLTQNDLVLRA